jgi:hypothetical protein
MVVEHKIPGFFWIFYEFVVPTFKKNSVINFPLLETELINTFNFRNSVSKSVDISSCSASSYSCAFIARSRDDANTWNGAYVISQPGSLYCCCASWSVSSTGLPFQGPFTADTLFCS